MSDELPFPVVTCDALERLRADVSQLRMDLERTKETLEMAMQGHNRAAKAFDKAQVERNEAIRLLRSLISHRDDGVGEWSRWAEVRALLARIDGKEPGR